MCEQTGKLERVKEMTRGLNQGSSLFITSPSRPLNTHTYGNPRTAKGQVVNIHFIPQLAPGVHRALRPQAPPSQLTEVPCFVNPIARLKR